VVQIHSPRPSARELGRAPFAFCTQTSARVAQLDRASASGAEGHRFESCRARLRLRSNDRDAPALIEGRRIFFSAPRETRSLLAVPPTGPVERRRKKAGVLGT
jgi:hypothetical protein